MSEKRLIDANELKDNFGFFRKMWSATEICGIIDAMPTADVTVQKWIPVSERLPKKDVDVLTRRACGIGVDCYEGYGRWCNDDVASPYKVTHWMPLPEPPKECE